jgi:uncharacterized membrane protein
MKKAGTLLKFGFVALATIAFGSAAHSQGAEIKPGQTTGHTVSQQKTGAMRGTAMTAEQSKVIIQNQEVKVATTNPARNCTPHSKMQANSISRKDFNNLPADRKEFVLNNSEKYTIVD